MSLPEGLLEPLIAHMGVDLRGRQRGMAEHLLDAAQVGSAFQQMGGHRMPQAVRADIGCLRDGVHGLMHHPPRDPRIQSATLASQKDSLRRRSGQPLRTPGQPRLHRAPGGVAQRDGALLVALAQHPELIAPHIG
ncbi:hypothetical protein SDC9_198324 [bioreactor metagenome]|uniref:Uncharacterized protein n=1 Tax=bioreactor metagenome TaxID=1076179 RepID=A0A645IIN3_9ZZZZ